MGLEEDRRKIGQPAVFKEVSPRRDEREIRGQYRGQDSKRRQPAVFKEVPPRRGGDIRGIRGTALGPVA